MSHANPIEENCPRRDLHTPGSPISYGGRQLWAEEMNRTHRQTRCPECRLYVVWQPRKDAPDLPSIDYRLDHRACNCCEGDPACDCRSHPEETKP